MGMLVIAPVNNGGATAPLQGVPGLWPLASDLANQKALSPVELVADTLNPGKDEPTSPYLNGKSRIVGVGFEVLNQTEVLNARGSVRVYSFNRAPTSGAGFDVTLSGNLRNISEAVSYIGPPATIEAAANIPNSASWHAAKGNYNVGFLAGFDQEFEQPVQAAVHYGAQSYTPGRGVPGGLDAAIDANKANQTLSVIGASGFSTQTIGEYPSFKKLTKFNTTGAYYTGLGKTNSLKVVLRVLVERAPAPTEEDLIVLATPSPEYDPVAWEFYSRAARKAPAGVPLSMNAMGDWFRDVADSMVEAYDTASPFIDMIAPIGGPKAILAAKMAKEARKTAHDAGFGKGQSKGARRRRRVREARNTESRELGRLSRKIHERR